MRMFAYLVAAAAVVAAVPATAAPATTQALSPAERAVPAQLSPAERATYRSLFADIDAGRYTKAQATLATLPDSPLKPVAEAQLMLFRTPARAQATKLADWLERNGDLPQASRILVQARALGASALPALPTARALHFVSYSYSRGHRVKSARAEKLAAAMRPLLSDDRPSEAEALWRQMQGSVSEEARTEWAQRTAWAYYLSNDDASAARMGATAADGQGDYAALGDWVAGLANWRMGNYARAAQHFDAVGTKAGSTALASAGAYWASRAHLASGRPQLVSARLMVAARDNNSFYGLLARRTLGTDYAQDWTEPDFIQADWNKLANLPGARRAAALVEIGQLGLADRELKHLAAITDPTNYDAIMRLAARLNLPATQYWLSQRSPNGNPAPLAARFPAPDWKPYRGWRIDQSLVFAHALQESNFVTDAVSHAGARGLMQLMPGTAREVSRDIGTAHDMEKLKDPSFNIEYGQTYLEELRDSVWTQGLLPKVVAAYNAGPGSVQKWNASLRDNGDPLLFIESIPFSETRHYVEVVLRNYWMYQLRQGQKPPSIDALAQGLWPRFPGLPGATAVKLDATRTTASAH